MRSSRFLFFFANSLKSPASAGHNLWPSHAFHSTATPSPWTGPCRPPWPPPYPSFTCRADGSPALVATTVGTFFPNLSISFPFSATLFFFHPTPVTIGKLARRIPSRSVPDEPVTLKSPFATSAVINAPRRDRFAMVELSKPSSTTDPHLFQ